MQYYYLGLSYGRLLSMCVAVWVEVALQVLVRVLMSGCFAASLGASGTIYRAVHGGKV